jgi:hypothetical protein
MPGRDARALARHKQSTGLFVSGLSPPASGFARHLLLYFAAAGTQHLRPNEQGFKTRLRRGVFTVCGLRSAVCGLRSAGAANRCRWADRRRALRSEVKEEVAGEARRRGT